MTLQVAAATWQADFYTSDVQNTLDNAAKFRTFAFTEEKADIDFNKFEDGGHLPADFQVDHFAARFTGCVNPPASGSYQFQVTGDDGIRLFVDGANVIASSAWKLQGSTSYYSGDMDLTSGSSVCMVVEYFERAGGAVLQLKWKGPHTDGDFVSIEGVSPGMGWQPMNYAVFGGYRYATLDDVAPTSTVFGCQEGVVEVPFGWEIVATSDAAVEGVLYKYPFGSECVVLGDGSALKTGQDADVCFNDGLENTDASFSVKSGECGRVLIRKAALSSDIDSASAEITNIIGFNGVTYATIDNAIPEGPASYCQSEPFAVPEGWTLAAADANTIAAIIGADHTFGVDCLAVEGGIGLSTVTGQPCGVDVLQRGSLMNTDGCGSRILISKPGVPSTFMGCFKDASARDLEGTKTSHSTFLSSLLCVDRCESEGFMYAGMQYSKECYCGNTYGSYGQRPEFECNMACAGNSDEMCGAGWRNSVYATSLAGVGATWRTSINEYTNTVRRGNFEYAVMDNTAANSGDTGSQGKSIALPFGWEIAPDDSESRAVIGSVHFGTFCVVVASGRALAHNLETCQDDVLLSQEVDGTTFYASALCSSRILIRHAYDFAAETETCGTCVSWGDPHFVTYDNKQFHFYGIGEFVLARPTADALMPFLDPNWFEFRVHAIHHGWRGVAANKGINIVYNRIDGVRWAHYIEFFVDTEGVGVWALPQVRINGEVTVFAQEQIVTLEGDDYTINITRHTGVSQNRHDSAGRARYTVSLPNHVEVRVLAGYWSNTNFLDVNVDVPLYLKGKTEGLCGSCDDNRNNDYKTPWGEIVPPNADKPSVHDYGLTWEAPTWDQTTYEERCDDGALNNGEEGVDCGGPCPDACPPPVVPNFDPCSEVTDQFRDEAEEVCALRTNTDALYDACLTDVCITGDLGAADGAEDVQTDIDSELNLEECAVSEITNTVTFGGRQYALLDNADPNEPIAGCQEGSVSIPDGWKIADDDFVTRAAIPCREWATECLVLSNGNAVDNKLDSCGTKQLVTVDESKMIKTKLKEKENEWNHIKKEKEKEKDIADDTWEIPTFAKEREDARDGINDVFKVKEDKVNKEKEALKDKEKALKDKEDSRCHGVKTCSARVLIVRDVAQFVANGDFEAESSKKEKKKKNSKYSDTVIGWQAWGSGFSLDPSDKISGGTAGNAVIVTATGSDFAGGLFQEISADNLPASSGSFSISAWSKAEDVPSFDPLDAAEFAYGLYVDVLEMGAETPTGTYAMFTSGTHDWEKVTVDVHLPENTQWVKVYLLYRGFSTGEVKFSAVSVGPPESRETNLIYNSEFSGRAGWNDFNDGSAVPRGFEIDENNRYPYQGGTGSLYIDGDHDGAHQGIYLEEGTSMSGLYVGAWSKTKGISGSDSASFAIYADLYYADGTTMFGLVLPLEAGTHNWQYHDTVHPVDRTKEVEAISINVISLGGGQAWFDGIVVIPSCSKIKPENCGQTYGDPHFFSLDGLAFDVQALGEFILVQDDGFFEVQTRHERAGGASVNSAAAIKCGQNVIQINTVPVKVEEGDELDEDGNRKPITNHQEPVVYLNGKREIIATNNKKHMPRGNSSVTARGEFLKGGVVYYDIVCLDSRLADGETVPEEVIYNVIVEVIPSKFGVQYIQLQINLPDQIKGQTFGLLGSNDGNRENDFLSAHDQQFACGDDGVTCSGGLLTPGAMAPVPWSNSWMVSDATTLFRYTGKQGPAEFVDHDFVPFTQADYPAAQVAEAEEACTSLSVALPNEMMLNACIMDYLFMGEVPQGYAALTASKFVYSEEALRPLDIAADKEEQAAAPASSSGVSMNFVVLGGVMLAALAGIVAVAVVTAHRSHKKKSALDQKRNAEVAIDDIALDSEAESEKSTTQLKLSFDVEADRSGVSQAKSVVAALHNLTEKTSNYSQLQESANEDYSSWSQ